MIKLGCKQKIVDNTSVKEVKIIKIQSKGTRGEVFLSAAHKIKSGSSIKKGTLVSGQVFHTKRRVDRFKSKTGILSSFPIESNGILIARQKTLTPVPLGKRVKKPVPSLFKSKAFTKVLAISGNVI